MVFKCCLCPGRVLKRKITYISQAHIFEAFQRTVGEQNVKDYPAKSILCKKCCVQIQPVGSRSPNDPPYSRELPPTQSVFAAPRPVEDNSMEYELSESHQSEESHNAPSSEADNQSDHETQPSTSSDLQFSRTQSSVSGRSHENSQLSDITNRTSSSQSSFILVPNVKSCSRTNARCLICRSVGNRCRIPKAALRQAWSERQIYIPSTNRVCKEHLNGKRFRTDALNAIIANKEGFEVTSAQLGEWLLSTTTEDKTLAVDFSNDTLPDNDYHLLTGFSKANFEYLSSFLLKKMRNSENRHRLNGLGMFLLLLRHNITQRFLAYLFNTTQQVVSEAIDSVSDVLDGEFREKYMGFQHLSSEELKAHSRPSFNKLLELNEECQVLICDGTYLFTERPVDFHEQQKTFSLHKHANLYKPMMTCLADGYLLSVDGLFYGDYHNNDAKILIALIKEEESKLMQFKHDNQDVALIVDRGFRDAIDEAESEGFKILMPELLDRKSKQFTSEQANQSRRVTMARWTIESVNGRFKNMYRFFREQINGHYREKIGKFFRVACAMINAFCGPLGVDRGKHLEFAELALSKVNQPNHLQQHIIDNKLERLTPTWEVVSASDLQDFPRLSMEELEKLGLGPYQLKIAENYIDHHMAIDGDLQIRLNNRADNIIRAQIFSRHSARGKYHVWVQYDPSLSGIEGVAGWYCHCKTGARTCGWCAHVACVIRYLSFDRHHAQDKRRRPPLSCFRDAGKELKALAALPASSGTESSDDD